MDANLLEVQGLVTEFDGLRAVDDVSFGVRPRTITGLIGPNGAGKTTVFNTVAGVCRPTRGAVRFNGEEIQRLPTHRIFRKGLVRTFQIPRPFPEMTVLENLVVVPQGQLGERLWHVWFNRSGVRRQDRAIQDRAHEIIDFLNLRRVADEYAKNLSGGQLKLVEIGRALMSEPQMILLDEPGAGVNPTLLAEIMERIRELHQRGITFLLIEHNMDLVMSLCDPILVMAGGRLLMEGDAASVRSDQRVLDAYLGGGT
jgi:ABC-type branched-subunit amino acid transport system ATPase component